MNVIEKLAALVEQYPLGTLSPVATLGGAIWQVRLPQESHQVVLKQLPDYIDAEFDHSLGAPKFLGLKRHLLLCPDCAMIYFDLLEIALLDQAHGFPKSEASPRPDLGFLKSNDAGE